MVRWNSYSEIGIQESSSGMLQSKIPDDIAAKCGTRLQVNTICHFERIHLIDVVLHQLLVFLLLLLQVPLNESLLELAKLPIHGWLTWLARTNLY